MYSWSKVNGSNFGTRESADVMSQNDLVNISEVFDFEFEID